MDKIVEVFRARGFDAASLDDVSAATGLSRPSLYAAFGDKLSMYLTAMDAFSEKAARRAASELQQGEAVDKALERFYAAMIDVYCSGGDAARGCLVWGTAPAAAKADEIRERLASGIRSLDEAMVSRIATLLVSIDGQRRLAAAELASNTLIGLSTRAKAGFDRNELLAQARRSARLIAVSLKTDMRRLA